MNFTHIYYIIYFSCTNKNRFNLHNSNCLDDLCLVVTLTLTQLYFCGDLVDTKLCTVLLILTPGGATSWTTGELQIRITDVPSLEITLLELTAYSYQLNTLE